MQDQDKTKNQLIDELNELRREIATLQDNNEPGAHWERIFNTIPDLVAILDTEHRIVLANKSLADRLGITQEKIIGMKCYQAVHGLDGPLDFCPHVKAMRDGKEHSAEITVTHLGGTFDVSSSPLFNTEGILTGGLYVARDVTERKAMERSLRESEQQLKSILSASP